MCILETFLFIVIIGIVFAVHCSKTNRSVGIHMYHDMTSALSLLRTYTGRTKTTHLCVMMLIIYLRNSCVCVLYTPAVGQVRMSRAGYQDVMSTLFRLW